MMLHLHENLWCNMPVSPPEIPLWVILIRFHFNFELFGNFGDNFVLTIWICEWIPETLMSTLSNRICWVQLGTNLGMMGSDPLSSLSLSLSRVFLFIDNYFITYKFYLKKKYIKTTAHRSVPNIRLYAWTILDYRSCTF